MKITIIMEENHPKRTHPPTRIEMVMDEAEGWVFDGPSIERGLIERPGETAMQAKYSGAGSFDLHAFKPVDESLLVDGWKVPDGD